jgi:hypothetical protein
MIPPVKFVTADKDYNHQRVRPEGSNNLKLPIVRIHLNGCTANAKDRRTKIRTYGTNVCGIGKLLQQNELYYDSGIDAALDEDTAAAAKQPWLPNCTIRFKTMQKPGRLC